MIVALDAGFVVVLTTRRRRRVLHRFSREAFMKIQKTLLLIVVSIILAAACATASAKNKTTVRSDYDHSANFAAYKTFAFVTPLGTEVDGYPAEITQNVKTAAEHELESRGYHKVDSNPDL